MGTPEQAEAFDWDPDDEERGNTAHLAEWRLDRPGISAAEAEEVFYNGGRLVPNVGKHSGDWKLIGTTDGGRRLTLVLSYDDHRRVIRFITGWTTTRGETSRYL